MSNYLWPASAQPSVPVAGDTRAFPVRRIYCVGRNYADHAREMGMDPVKESPFFFGKPADALLADGADFPYPPRSANVHHEVELVVAIGRGGRNIPVATAQEHIFGYAVGNDYTRRDLQKQSKDTGQPWDTAKGFDHSAGIGAIHPVARIGHPAHARIWLTVNGSERQHGDIADLIWDVPSIVAELSTYVELAPGDLVYTGTPAGVGPVVPGDVVIAGIDGLGTLTHRVRAAS